MKKRIKSKNYQKWLIIDILAIILIFVLTLIFTELSGTVEKELGYTPNSKDIFYLVVLFICTLPTYLCYLAIYFGIRYTIRKIEKKNLTYNAPEDILYFRDVLSDLSPYEVSILANLNIEEKKDAIATILWYQNKGYLNIQNNQITYSDNLNLTKKEEFFFKFLKTKDLGYLESYKNITYKELLDKNYLQENNQKSYFKSVIKNIIWIFILFIIIIGLILINEFFIKNLFLEKIIDIFIIAALVLVTYKKISHLMIGYKFEKSKYRRTPLGEEKTMYIHALQNFLHDFSNLKEATKEQLILWEDFLVYAIILEENSKIIQDIIGILESKHEKKLNTTLTNLTNIFNE